MPSEELLAGETRSALSWADWLEQAYLERLEYLTEQLEAIREEQLYLSAVAVNTIEEMQHIEAEVVELDRRAQPTQTVFDRIDARQRPALSDGLWWLWQRTGALAFVAVRKRWLRLVAAAEQRQEQRAWAQKSAAEQLAVLDAEDERWRRERAQRLADIDRLVERGQISETEAQRRRERVYAKTEEHTDSARALREQAWLK